MYSNTSGQFVSDVSVRGLTPVTGLRGSTGMGTGSDAAYRLGSSALTGTGTADGSSATSVLTEKTTLSKLTEVIVHGNDYPNISYAYENATGWDNLTFTSGLGPGGTTGAGSPGGGGGGGAASAEYEYYINGVVTNVIVLLGLVGNILTIVILAQRAMRSSTNIYLSALAWWDTMVLISTALLIGLPTACKAYSHHVLAYVVSYIYPVALIAQTATIWLTVSFTVERYIAVCHPLKAASMCTIHRAKVVIACVSIGSTLYNVPRWFEYRPQALTPPGTNSSIVIPGATAFSVNPIYVQVYFSWLYVPIMCIIPLVVLSALNLFLVLAVRRSQRQRKDMNVKQSRENNVTIMLVSVVLVFIICQVPALVYNLAYAIDREYVLKNNGYHVLSTLRNFLVTLNSAINFLLYCALGQKFRRIFLHTFCRRCVKENYMPMSGVYQHTTMVAMPSTRHRHYNHAHGGGRSAMLSGGSGGCSGGSGGGSRGNKSSMDALNHSTSTCQTTGTSSQESSLMSPTSLSPGRSGGRSADRHVHTFTAPKMNKTLCHSSSMDRGDRGGADRGGSANISHSTGMLSSSNSKNGGVSVADCATDPSTNPDVKSSKGGGGHHLDSDDDPAYDVTLMESLLPEPDRDLYHHNAYNNSRSGRVNSTMAM